MTLISVHVFRKHTKGHACAQLHNRALTWPVSTRTHININHLCAASQDLTATETRATSKTHTENAGKHITFICPITVLSKQMETCSFKQLLQYIYKTFATSQSQGSVKHECQSEKYKRGNSNQRYRFYRN